MTTLFFFAKKTLFLPSPASLRVEKRGKNVRGGERKKKKKDEKTPNVFGRHWCFTVFDLCNPNKSLLINLKKHAKHYAWQLEQCPETGRLHMQCYVGFELKIRLTSLKKLLPPGCHVELAHNPGAAYTYCQKEDTCADETSRVCCGCPPPSQNSGLIQNQWADFKEYSKTHSWNECKDKFVCLRVHESVMRRIYEERFPKIATRQKQVVCFWGPSDTGKTYVTRGIIGERDYYRTFSGKWFDQYDYEDILWIDDMEPGRFTRDFFLQLLDPGFVRAEIKGGTTLLVANLIIITSNYDPRTWFPMGEVAVLRRMDVYYLPHGVKKLKEIKLCQRRGNTIPAVGRDLIKAVLQRLEDQYPTMSLCEESGEDSDDSFQY